MGSWPCVNLGFRGKVTLVLLNVLSAGPRREGKPNPLYAREEKLDLNSMLCQGGLADRSVTCSNSGNVAELKRLG